MVGLNLSIKFLLFLLFIIFAIVVTPSRSFGTRCDCKPEFEVSAEAEGICEIIRDDKNWCEIKFNSSTGRGTRQNMFFDTVLKLGLKVQDNVTASQRFNTVEPEMWDISFINEDLVSLLAVALWEKVPERIKPIIELVRKTSGKILEGMKMPPQKLDQFTLEKYNVTVSRGCLDLDDKVFAVMIKTRFSEANLRCKFISSR